MADDDGTGGPAAAGLDAQLDLSSFDEGVQASLSASEITTVGGLLESHAALAKRVENGSLAGLDSKLDVGKFDEAVQVGLKAKSIDTVGGLWDSYAALEKRVGAKTLEQPEAGKLGEWMKSHGEVFGVPENADGYELPEVKLPEGMKADEELGKRAQAFAHENGIPREMFGKFAEFVIQDRVNMWNAAAETAVTNEAKLKEDLRNEWKNDYDTKVEQAQLAARELGLDNAVIDKLDGELGSATMLKMFQNIGARIAEGGIMLGDGGGPADVLTAKTKLEELRADEGFQKKLNDRDAPGHKEAVDLWAATHAAAAGEKTA